MPNETRVDPGNLGSAHLPPDGERYPPISTVSKDYAMTEPTSSRLGPLFSAPTLETGQFELDESSKFDALKSPRHCVKKCICSYQSLPTKTRQTVRIATIAVFSAVTLLAIFYIARFADTSTDADVNNLEDQDAVFIESGHDSKGDAEDDGLRGGMRVPLKVFKDLQGKAREYDKMHAEGRIPIRPRGPPFDIAKIKAKRKLFHPANATEISQTIDLVRKKVDAGRKKISSKELRLWEPGTEPLRILLVSTWRSGSTFLGQTLQSHPGVFQHYEPLAYLGVRQLRSGKEALQAQQLVHQLLDCQYKGAAEYLTYLRKYPEDMIGHNVDIYSTCKEGPNPLVCHNETFLSDVCKLFPIQIVKTVRMRLNMTQLLLNDDKLRTKVVFLVRDPRGTMSSRYTSVSWCNTSPDCSSPAILCDDLQGDLKVATAFKQLYPDRFTMLKFEDLATNPEEETMKLFSFLGLEYTKDTSEFLFEHTNNNKDAAWSTNRKSKDRITLWKKQLPLEEIHDVQNSCNGVLKTLKYEIIGA